MNVNELRERLGELYADAQSIQAKADDEKRDLTADEEAKIKAHFDEFERVEAEIARREKLSGLQAKIGDDTPQPRKVAASGVTDAAKPNGKGAALQTGYTGSQRDADRFGWRSFGDFCKGVVDAARGTVDPRLISAATLGTYGAEGTGADGGFAVPPEWRATIMKLVMAEDSLLSRTDQQTASGNQITFPNDETTPWQTTGGILAYWDGEAASMSQSKPLILPLTLRLNRLTALVPVTDELLEDSAAMASYVQTKAGEKIAFKINNAIINGDGAGMPLGITVSSTAVSVAKETSQVAATVVAANVAKMWARLYGPSRANAVWLINQDVEPQLYQMVIMGKNVAGTENVGVTTPVFVPQGGFSTSPFATMFGRPVITTEACATLGTVGDIILADLTKYLTVTKASGLRSDVSIHLWFDQATTAFRFIMRLAGQPWLSKPISRASGSNTLSHFVTLATRS